MHSSDIKTSTAACSSTSRRLGTMHVSN